MMLFKGYFKAALVLSFALMGSGAAAVKPGAGQKTASCHLESKTGPCPCREANKGDDA